MNRKRSNSGISAKLSKGIPKLKLHSFNNSLKRTQY